MKTPFLSLLAIGSLVACSGFLIGSDDSKADAIRKDRMQYEGIWVVTALEVDGNKAAEEDCKKISVVNHDGKWTLQVEGKSTSHGISEIDPTKKPKALDFVPAEGEDKGKTFLGIYEITVDTRRLCFAGPGKSRPIGFSSKPGSGHIYVEFKRAMR